MRYILIICNDPTGESYDAEYDDARDWTEALQASGSNVLGDRLWTVEDATTVRVRGGERIVADGPFTESCECIAGFEIPEADTSTRRSRSPLRIPWRGSACGGATGVALVSHSGVCCRDLRATPSHTDVLKPSGVR